MNRQTDPQSGQRTPAPPESAAPSTGSLRRRTVLRAAGAGGLVLLAGGWAYFGGRRGAQQFRITRPAMGTTATILLTHHSREIAEEIATEALAAIADVERRMSRYRAESEVGRLNSAPGTWQTVSTHTARVLRTGLSLARASDGSFDPCLDRLVSLWGFHDRAYPAVRPDPGVLRPQPQSANYRALESRDGPAPSRLGAGASRQNATASRTGAEGGEFRLNRATAGIDLGGIAKGYAIDRAVARLRELGVDNALVNVGDDIRALGSAPDGAPWRVGVRHPRRKDDLLEVLHLRDRAVATSGDYENYFRIAGRRYSHLLDPHTGEPASTHRSLTVTAENAMLADALATAGFTSPTGQARRLLERFAQGPWLAVDRRGDLYRG